MLNLLLWLYMSVNIGGHFSMRVCVCSFVVTLFMSLQVNVDHAVSWLSVNLLKSCIYALFCITGEGGHFEVYRHPDVTDGSSRLCELQ